MYQQGFYKQIDEARIIEEVRREGFDPLPITDPPSHRYPPHRHPEIKLLVFLAGEMEVTVGAKSYQCSAGDRLVIQGNVEHSATVGPEGCVFLWSEKMDEP